MNGARRQGGRAGTWLAGNSSRGVLGVLIGLAVIWLGYTIAGSPLFVREHLLLTPTRGLGPEPWQLLTNGFIHPRFAMLLSSAITIFFFGAPVEQQIGRARLFTLRLGATLIGSIGAAAVGRLIAPSSLIAGAAPACMALLAAFGVLYSRTPLSLFGASTMSASMNCAAAGTASALPVDRSSTTTTSCPCSSSTVAHTLPN